MIDPTESVRAYVRAALELQGYQFTDECIADITLQFARIESIARALLPADAALEAGPAPVFRP